MSRSALRPIVVVGTPYLWTLSQKISPPCAQTKFTAYLAPHKRHPLTLLFTTWDDPRIGNPLNTGWPTTCNGAEVLLNLNHPHLAQALIAYGLAHGWAPHTSKGALTITNGLAVLTALGYAVLALQPKD